MKSYVTFYTKVILINKKKITKVDNYTLKHF